MSLRPVRRRRFAAVAAVLAALGQGSDAPPSAVEGVPCETMSIVQGALKLELRDNARSPKKALSGLAALVNEQDAPGFDAFDPVGEHGPSGLNFEHITSGHAHPANKFAPRNGPYRLFPLAGGASGQLVRKADDDPWKLSSKFRYTAVAPHFIDFEFRCVPHDATLFGPRGYALLFFADYMNDVEDVALHFRGVAGPDQSETWISADAPQGHPDWDQGGTYRSLRAAALTYDADHNFKLNSWSYDYPRFTKPFYYGRAANGMVFILMFNKMYSNEDEIRFSLFKFRLPRYPRPAWDFQYVIHRVETGKEYGFRGRLVWKKFVSPGDCLAEYERWAASAR